MREVVALGGEPRVPATPTIITRNHRLRLLPDMRVLLDTFFGDVERATQRVDVECFIVNDDVLGHLLGIALANAAARGVRTRLLYDPLGSQTTAASFFENLREQGVDVRPYRDIGFTLVGKGRFVTRDHGRVMVVDNAAYTGGAAWGDQWLPAEEGGKGWHDVCCRAEGLLVEDFAALFEQRWREALGDVAPKDFDTGDRYPDVRLVSDTPDEHDVIVPLHCEAIARAERRVWLAHAYFYPSQVMKHALYAAASRGVDVRVITVGETDLPIMKRAARADYEEWLANGLRIHEYAPTVMHCKYAVVDDDWCSVGTYNANPTSSGVVNEVNLLVYDRAYVAELAAQFERDLAVSEAVTVESARDRTVLRRIGDRLAATALKASDAVMGPRHEGARAGDGSEKP